MRGCVGRSERLAIKSYTKRGRAESQVASTACKHAGRSDLATADPAGRRLNSGAALSKTRSSHKYISSKPSTHADLVLGRCSSADRPRCKPAFCQLCRQQRRCLSGRQRTIRTSKEVPRRPQHSERVPTAFRGDLAHIFQLRPGDGCLLLHCHEHAIVALDVPATSLANPESTSQRRRRSPFCLRGYLKQNKEKTSRRLVHSA